MEKRVYVKTEHGHEDRPRRRRRDEDRRHEGHERRERHEYRDHRNHEEHRKHRKHRKDFDKHEFFKKMMFQGKSKTKMFMDKLKMVEYVNEVGEEGYHIDIFKIEENLYKVVVSETEHQLFDDVDVEIEIEEE